MITRDKIQRLLKLPSLLRRGAEGGVVLSKKLTLAIFKLPFLQRRGAEGGVVLLKRTEQFSDKLQSTISLSRSASSNAKLASVNSVQSLSISVSYSIPSISGGVTRPLSLILFAVQSNASILACEQNISPSSRSTLGRHHSNQSLRSVFFHLLRTFFASAGRRPAVAGWADVLCGEKSLNHFNNLNQIKQMKTKQFKSAFKNTVLSVEPLKEFWSMFSDVYKYEDPGKAFLFANSENFKDNIFEFEPQLAPIIDYDVEIGKFDITEKYFNVSVEKTIDDDYKISMNYDDCIYYSNGVKQKIKNPKEYCRLVIVHVMTRPVEKEKHPFMIFKLESKPKPFSNDKRLGFRVPVTDEIDKEFGSYKYHRTFAFLINFFTEKEENEKGETEIFENIISCSGVHYLNTMLIEDSDIQIIYPPHFGD